MKKTIKNKFIVSVKVGEKGQIIVPKEAREMFNISSGDTLLFLGDKQKGLALVKADAIYDLVDDRK
ncbi:MAG: AbrB/MazE/SpoVT family DNA-binding domain-containing protein [Firmicutes bacterium]|nr:AbrB/MazE/SpoVT family DNA-binding domain-containing protein [Candidatus Fiminaster equi]